MNRALVPLEQRFAERCKLVESGCVEWTAGRIKDRYGKETYGNFYAENEMHLAHRWIYKRKIGPVPEGLDVCHKCDNPACVNLDHLFIGTRQQNMDDCVTKGRISHATKNEGESHPMATLTEEDVRDIRHLREFQHHTLIKLSSIYKVSIAQISRIVKYQSWSNVS